MAKIPIKTSDQLVVMSEGGGKLALILNEVLRKITSGISTLQINNWVEDGIAQAGGIASFKQVPRYRWASCVGINNEVVHSIPKKDKVIKDGDILKIDAGMLWKGFNTDVSWTTIVPSTDYCLQTTEEKLKNRFLTAGEEALKKAIEAARPGNRIGHISLAMQKVIEKAGYFPVKILTGHGIGRNLHEEPLIPCFLQDKVESTALLMPGMSLAIEVIYTLHDTDLVMEKDNWTISTKDGKMAGLFEETVAVTENGPLILTAIEEKD